MPYSCVGCSRELSTVTSGTLLSVLVLGFELECYEVNSSTSMNCCDSVKCCSAMECFLA